MAKSRAKVSQSSEERENIKRFLRVLSVYYFAFKLQYEMAVLKKNIKE